MSFLLEFTEVSCARDYRPRSSTVMEWSEFVAAFKRREGSNRTHTEKDGIATIGATFHQGGRITKANVASVTFLGLDIDGDPAKGQVYLPPEEVHALIPFRALGYSTFSSRLERRKYRLIFPLLPTISPDEHLRLWLYANYRTGGRLMDPATKNPDRLFYDPRWPETCDDRWVREFGGPWLSMAFVPTEFEAPQQIIQTSHRKAQRALQKQRPKAEAIQVLNALRQHPFVAWAFDHADDLGREPWRGLAGNMVAACDGHPDLLEFARAEFHYTSEPAACYREAECDREFDRAIESVAIAGPMTWARMVEHGVPAEVCVGGTNLVTAARAEVRTRRSP